MTITRHLQPDMLMACAAGSQPEAIAAVVSSHLAVCCSCRTELAAAHRIGVVLFEGLEPTPLRHSIPHVAAAYRADGQTEAAPDRRLPAPVDLDARAWVSFAPGVWVHTVALSGDAEGALCHLRLERGAALQASLLCDAQTGHVLRGSCALGDETCYPGDVIDFTLETPADLAAVGDRGAILLIASERALTTIPMGATLRVDRASV